MTETQTLPTGTPVPDGRGVVPLHPAAKEGTGAPSELYGSAWSAEEAAAAARTRDPAPQLTYRGGPLLGAVRLAAAFWGGAWQSADLDPLRRALDAFCGWLPTSPLLEQLSEYSVPGDPQKQIGPGTYLGSVVLTQAGPGNVVADSDLQVLLAHQVAEGVLPAPDAGGNTLYMLFVPPGSAVEQQGDRSCATFCGYHDVCQSPGGAVGPLYYAVLPVPGCPGCLGPLQTLDALTTTASHEFCEAVTDPVPGQGWYDDTYGEIGDICAWTTKQLEGPNGVTYTVQKEWSNRAGACV